MWISTSGTLKNAYGEQALFVFDHTSQAARLYLGDAGWETDHAVIDGMAADLVLGEAELLWLRACWQSCYRRPPLAGSMPRNGTG